MWTQSWHFRTLGIHEVEAMRHWETLPSVPATSVGDVCRQSADLVIWLNVINVTEHSSPPSLPTPFATWLLLSSPCRMETAPGFSPWGSVMPQCGMWCLALNSPINKLNQHLFVRAGRCREWCPSGRSEIGRSIRTLGIHKVEAMQHLRNLRTVLAMSVGDVCSRLRSLWSMSPDDLNPTEHRFFLNDQHYVFERTPYKAA